MLAQGGESIAENRYAAGTKGTTNAKPVGARFVVRLPVAKAQRGGASGGRRS